MDQANLAGEKKSGGIKRFFTGYAVIVFIIASFLGGLIIGENKNAPAKISEEQGKIVNKEAEPEYLKKDVDFGLYWNVIDIIKQKYLEQPASDSKMFYGSLAGLVASLGDPYSMYFDPETAQKFNEELSGAFEGIGAEVGIKNNRLTIVAPLPDSPAEKAGLKAGDKIYAIDDIDTTGIALDYAVSLIRGKDGTEVKLLISRDGIDAVQEYKIKRAVITIKSVEFAMKENNIAYIKLSYFNEDTASEFNRVIQEVLAKNPKGIILDMRNNPGGFLSTAVTVASAWIEDGPIVVEEFGDKTKDNYPAEGRANFKNYKTVVLVNGGSASASEIVAGALQDYGKATLVGEKTFGKGSVQELESLKDGSAVKITIAHWLTPNGRLIDKEGIKPDVEIKLSKEDYNADKDPQMDKALELLK
jgi:carboxyl-terminal processing protease